MSSGRRKLLLADDSPTIRKVISLTFGDEDDGEFEVVAVGDGAQALRVLAEDPPPDIVLADLVMPGPDGYELCERIKRDERLKRIPVVLLVGTFEPFNEAEARRVGADTVLTKPFQSIRNLVGKVGSLLGGESKAEEPEAARAPQEEPRAAAEPVRADEAARFEAREAESHEEPAGHHVEDPGASFADLGADDELIEARPAEAFGAPPSFARRRSDASAEAEAAPEFDAAPSFETNGGAPEPQVAAAPAPSEEEDDFVLDVAEPEEVEPEPEPVYAASLLRESVMNESNAPQTSFEPRRAVGAPAEDALLDLEQSSAPAAVATAEVDDFILDLGFDEEPAVEPAGFEPEPEETPLGAENWADAPSAFAEAAHGESQQQSEASPQHEETPWRDVVVQDGPQGFAFGGESQGAGAAPRGFVEPEVVPADEPVPAAVASEFTDGRVEGDLPKPPVAQPTTAGYVVSEGHTRVEEPLRADQLSQQVIETIARRVVEMMSDKAVREIAWEVVPEMAELLIKQKMEEEKSRR
ncbi:MAG: response regulator [Acidobacteria bacterium]|nr:response regulator [Acidobacteriota bacterium]